MVDSVAAAAGGIGSVSSNTSYIESAAGVGEGARTGLASVITGAGFLLAMFFAPLINIVPSEAATPALVFVGFLMMSQVTKIDWEDVEEGLPAFLTMVLMPFTFSITIGIGAGFISYVVLKVARGKARRVHPLMWLVVGTLHRLLRPGSAHPRLRWLTRRALHGKPGLRTVYLPCEVSVSHACMGNRHPVTTHAIHSTCI